MANGSWLVASHTLSKTMTLASDLTGFTQSPETTNLGTTNSQTTATGCSNNSGKWTVYAISSGPNNIANIRGKIQFSPSIIADGQLSLRAIAKGSGPPDVEAGEAIVDEIVGFAGSVGVPYTSAAATVLSWFDNDMSATVGAYGRAVIEGVGESSDIESEYTYDQAEWDDEVGWICPNENNIIYVDLDALNISGTRTLLPNEETKMSVSAISAVNLIDDSYLGWAGGYITVSESGSVETQTTRPTFVSD